VSKLHGDIGMRHAQFEQVCSAEVAQLIEVHLWTTESYAHKTPIVQMTAL
jgi:hypothetical protein